ncbi:hypothetical protein Dda_6728 [Drechslerella dactyloides]|uniref:DUF7896 domain-containing protein n=1 Tax=Drechslerella dactyloides TaxID=74499 RepID=A0AAD6IU21_DREDA|nr:hypothetical protein Dda_6728 [Drechslerella dactyloides]
MQRALKMDPPSGAAHDPVRQQFLRQLHWFLSQITAEAIQETGNSNFDKQKRNDKFYNSLKILADHVVRFNDNREKIRESASASISAPRATTGEYAGLQASSAPTGAFMHTQSAGSVAQQNSELGSLAQSSLPKHRNFTEAQMAQGHINIPAPISGVSNGQSVSPTMSLEASFAAMPSLQGSRAHSSESVPTVGAMSAPRSPVVNPTRSSNNMGQTAPGSSTSQSKPSTNFGFAVPLKRPAPSIPPLQAAAISSTVEIEAAANDLMNPRRDSLKASQAPDVGRGQPHYLSTSGTAPIINNADDGNNSSGSRKRKRQKKQWCPHCNDHKEGFRGPHELARHMNIQHTTKKTVYIVYDDSPEQNMFKDCKHCTRRKIYGQDYNAACHLRRAHFNKRLKTDTPAQREFKQLHPDHPPMEELRPWLRKCIVDVSKLKEKKYIDSQDEAIIKMEPAVKYDDQALSDLEPEQDQDHLISDDDCRLDGPATPPPEPHSELEQQLDSQQSAPKLVMNDSMLDSFVDLDFQFGLDSTTGMFDDFTQQPEFVFNAPSVTAPPLPQQQQSSVPRGSSTKNLFASQLQFLGIQPNQIVSDNIPDFVGLDPNAMFGLQYDMAPSDSNSVEVSNGGDAMSFDNFDFNQFLHGTIMN